MEFRKSPGKRNVDSTNEVVTHQTFLDCFIKDLSQARGLVLIQSPFITVRRLEKLRAALRNCIYRGVRVCVFGQLPKEKRGQSAAGDVRLDALESAASVLQSLKVHVSLVPRIHEKLAVIDERILWDGSLNILSHFDTAERMTRWVSRSKVLEAISLHGLDSCGECKHTPNPGRIAAGAMSPLKLLGSDIAERRRLLGLTQVGLAEESRVSQRIISDIELGKRDVHLSTLDRVARTLGLNLRLIPWHLLASTHAKLEDVFSDYRDESI